MQPVGFLKHPQPIQENDNKIQLYKIQLENVQSINAIDEALLLTKSQENTRLILCLKKYLHDFRAGQSRTVWQHMCC